MKIKIRDMRIILLYIIANAFLIVGAAVAISFEADVCIAWLSFVQVVFTITCFILQRKDYVLIGVIFILFTYIFHFGQELITILNMPDTLYEYSVRANTPNDIYREAEIFVMACIGFIGIGYLIANNGGITNSAHAVTLEDDLWEVNRIRKISGVIVAVTFFPMLYIDFAKIIALINGNYETTYDVYKYGLGKYMNLFGQFCKPSFLVFTYSYAKEKHKFYCIAALSLMYLLLMMISGDRGSCLIFIISTVYIVFLYGKKPSWKVLIIVCIGTYYLLKVLSAISIFRYLDFSFESFIEAMERRANDGIIYSSLREYGRTMESVTLAVQYIPSYNSYGYGLTYITAPLMISPWLPEPLVNFLEYSVTFFKAFPKELQTSLGGSYIGELYYNFGQLGSIAAIFIGVLIGKVESRLRNTKSIREMAVAIVLLPSLIHWVRDFVSMVLFKTFWLWLLFYFTKIRRKNETSINHNNRPFS